MDIQHNLDAYLYGDERRGGVRPNERYASFDYCYNYFQSFRERQNIPDIASRELMQTSCLQIGFYLASWGMLRASSFLLQKSVRHYEPLIEGVAQFPVGIWEIDVDRYTEENIELLLTCERMICRAIGQGRGVTVTLTTKIMLGIFGNVPAFDSFFKRGFGAHTFSARSLRRIDRFYQQHSQVFDAYRIHTLDFASGTSTHRLYPKAKLVDMACFVEGGR
jgi:hypothetical protein